MSDSSDAGDDTSEKKASAVPTAAARLRALLTLTGEAVISIDERQRVVLFNRGAEEMFGYSAEEMLGEPISRLLPMDARAGHGALVAGAMKEERLARHMAARRTVRGRRRHGEEFEAHISISATRTPAGVVGTAIVRDLSQLRAAESAQRASEARYRTVLEASPAGILTARPDGVLLSANAAVAEMLGLESGTKVIGLNMTTFLAEASDWDRIVTALDAARPSAAADCLLKDGAGRVVPALLKAVRVPGEDGEVDTINVFLLDVSALRKAEEIVRRTENLDLVGRWAGGVAHDFNNLIQVIRLSAAMIGEETALSDVGRRDLQGLEKAAVRAGELTQQLLAFGRQQVLRPAAVDVGVLVQRLTTLMQRLLGENVRLRLALPDAPLFVMADAAQLERVLANLATNARDAMPTGGAVDIRLGLDVPGEADRRRSPQLTPVPHVHLSFSDSGAGMDEAVTARIFDPFYTTKTLGRGTGLGLASVYGIVSQSLGHIVVESAVGLGTTLHLWFPRTHAGGPPSPGLLPEAVSATAEFALPITVLLIEDEADVRRGVMRVLEERGITVLPAADAGDALRVLARYEDRVDAIISDIVLPDMSGQRIVDRIADLHPHMKILFISGYSPETADSLGSMRPGSAFLPKPFAPSDLLRELAALLRRP